MDTPCVVVDLAVVKRNIERTQAIFDRLGVAFRPHIKTHKIPELALAQVKAGARGITCQKIGEAEVMADSGIDDILITYNIVGAEKLARLKALAERCKLSVTADNADVIDGLSAAFADAPKPLEVLVECDTGHHRCGVQTPEEALALARRIHAAPGLTLGGLMTYPPMTGLEAVNAWLARAKALLQENGLPCPRVSNGGTPNLDEVAAAPVATEHRAGTYIYNDRSLVERGACEIADCAATVKATVVSRPTDTRAVIDAGSKILTSDLMGLKNHGLIVEGPGAKIVSLSEEHGVVDLSETDWRPKVGDVVTVIPNHICVVENMVDAVTFVEPDGSTRTVKVAARGLSR